MIKEGYTPNAINTGNGVLYAPEQDVWAFGTGIASFETATGDAWIYQFDVSPKTKRRMKKGDKLYLSIVCTQNASAIITTRRRSRKVFRKGLKVRRKNLRAIPMRGGIS